jgi:hypothetical protein
MSRCASVTDAPVCIVPQTLLRGGDSVHVRYCRYFYRCRTNTDDKLPFDRRWLLRIRYTSFSITQLNNYCPPAHHLLIESAHTHHAHIQLYNHICMQHTYKNTNRVCLGLYPAVLVLLLAAELRHDA